MATRIVSIVGARPQFVKLAPICRAIWKLNQSAPGSVQHVIVHTGQHYDSELSQIFFDELEMPSPDINLGVGSGPHGRQTGRMLEAFEDFILQSKPDALIVYGDTNSTIAGALVGVKQHVVVAHVEAGLRSFNRMMPEEINRIATDHVSDVLYAPTPSAMKLLEREGLVSRAFLSGDVNFDAVLQNSEIASRKSGIVGTLGVTPGRYVLLTVHRSENTDAGRLMGLLEALGELASAGLQVIFPIHPRTVPLLPVAPELFDSIPGLRIIKPVGFLDMLELIRNARVVLTDSGGIQKEAFFLDVPCVTLRDETEWTETVEEGGNVLAGLSGQSAMKAIADWESRRKLGAIDFSKGARRAFGDGDAAEIIVRHLLDFLARSRESPATHNAASRTM